MDHSGKYVDRDLYLIVIDKDGMRVVHGQNPSWSARAISIRRRERQSVRQGCPADRGGSGQGLGSFAFKDPITGKVLPKENYVEKAGDYTYLAGVYTR